MKPTSLEQERQALLEQIHSSRAAYRRMLAQYDQPEPAHGAQAAGSAHAGPHVRGMPADFPRSITMRWIVMHPYAAAGITAGLIALAAAGATRAARPAARTAFADRRIPARSAGAVRSVPPRHLYNDREIAPSRRPAMARAAFASVAGLASMVMRDPARMRMLARAATTATEWLRNRRQQRHSNVRQHSTR